MSFNYSNKNYDGSNGIFPPRDKEDQAKIIAHYLPTGKHLRSKFLPGKNLYKLLVGFGRSFVRFEEKVNALVNGILITESTVLLEEYEKFIGSPDEYYTELGSVENRRKYIQAKISADGVSLPNELEWICSILGFTVTVIPGHYFWENPTDTRVIFDTEKESRFTIVFEIDYQNSVAIDNVFPFTFPIIFKENIRDIMEKFLLSLIDSNVNGVFIAKKTVSRIIKDSLGAENVIKDTYEDSNVIKDLNS